MIDKKTGLTFVVTGCGRSATKYAACLFYMMGFPCGHEEVFSEDGIKTDHNYIGDASWRSAPFLKDFHGIVFHQLRHPLSVINSLVLLYQGWGKEGMEWSPYVDVDCPAEIAAMRIYTVWNQMCECGSPYIRYRVEELTPEMLSSFCSFLGEVKPLEVVKQILAFFPKKVNWHGGADLTWDDLPDCPEKEELYKLSKRYGYNPKETYVDETVYVWEHECGYITKGHSPPEICPACGSKQNVMWGPHFGRRNEKKIHRLLG